MKNNTIPLSEGEQAERRECFQKGNHCLALEGMIVTSEELAEQEKVIRGEWSYDDLVDHIRARCGVPRGDAGRIVK